MSTQIDYAQPRRIDWDAMLTRACGLCAFACVALADTLTARLYEFGAWVVGVVW